MPSKQGQTSEGTRRQTISNTGESPIPENHAPTTNPQQVASRCTASKKRATTEEKKSPTVGKGSTPRTGEPYYALLDTLGTMGERNEDPDLINDEGPAGAEYHRRFQTYFKIPDEEKIHTQGLLVILSAYPDPRSTTPGTRNHGSRTKHGSAP